MEQCCFSASGFSQQQVMLTCFHLEIRKAKDVTALITERKIFYSDHIMSQRAQYKPDTQNKKSTFDHRSVLLFNVLPSAPRWSKTCQAIASPRCAAKARVSPSVIKPNS